MEKTHDLDMLFAQWSADRQAAAPTPLRIWLDRYPEHAADLLQWAAQAPLADRAETLYTDPEGEARTLAAGLKAVAEFRARYETSLTSLLTRGLNATSLAERLSLSVPLVFKLERRLLSFASLPAVLIDRLAEALQVTERQVRDYLNQPPTLAAGANYRADSAPKAVRQQDFLQAVRTDHEMTEEQKAFWSKI
ncbi:MAG TPA: hypothetical protein VFA07_03060 [Chthonomonadaceae bacterium]|nr:hypothetical protein [Chthonomonadaceae bacterium]